jgi:DNA invertase Pin-like site-specific DNA recombinase
MLGYATASTTGQDLDAQLSALAAAGVDRKRVFTDKLTGSTEKVRPGLLAMLSYARPRDVVVVVALDRLGRSIAEVAQTVAALTARGIGLRALKEGLDTATATGRTVAAIMTSLAELDRGSDRDRQDAHQPGQRVKRDG